MRKHSHPYNDRAEHFTQTPHVCLQKDQLRFQLHVAISTTSSKSCAEARDSFSGRPCPLRRGSFFPRSSRLKRATREDSRGRVAGWRCGQVSGRRTDARECRPFHRPHVLSTDTWPKHAARKPTRNIYWPEKKGRMPPPVRAFSRPVRDGGCVAAFACAARGATHNLRLSQRREIHRIGTRTIASSLTSRVMRDVTSFVRSPAEPCLSKQLRPATKAHLNRERP